MAGVESMIVEEKQPPTKQIDREKVRAHSDGLSFTDVGEERKKKTHKHAHTRAHTNTFAANLSNSGAFCLPGARRVHCCCEYSAPLVAIIRRPNSATAIYHRTNYKFTHGRMQRCAN